MVNTLCEILELLVHGSIENWKGFQAKNSAFLKQHNISEAELQRKLRVLTLCTLCEGKSEVKMEELRTALKVFGCPNS